MIHVKTDDEVDIPSRFRSRFRGRAFVRDDGGPRAAPSLRRAIESVDSPRCRVGRGAHHELCGRREVAGGARRHGQVSSASPWAPAQIMLGARAVWQVCGREQQYAQQGIAAGGARGTAALALEGQILAAQGKVDAAIGLLAPEKNAQGVGGRRVRLVLGELLLRAGRRAEAEPVLLEFANEYGSDRIPSSDAEGLAMVGRAMHLLRHAKDANRAYNESERAERGRVETLPFARSFISTSTTRAMRRKFSPKR